MRKGLFALVALGLLAPAGLAHAETRVLVEDDLLVGNPLGAIGGGVSEIVADCDPDAQLQGIDGVTFAIPAAARGKAATLTSTGAGALDVDVYWYDERCRPDLDASFTRRGTGNETGTIPADAVVGVVDLIAGANAHVKVTATI